MAVAVPLSCAAWLGGNAVTLLTGAGPTVPFQPTGAVLHPHELWSATNDTALTMGTLVFPLTLLLTLAAVTARLYLRRQNGPRGHKPVSGMATVRDIQPLLSKQVTAKAQQLRPSLATVDPRKIEPKQTGALLGNLAGTRHEVRSGLEDVGVCIMTPRSGKTTCLAIPLILDAPGAVLLTSNKAAQDAYTATIEARGTVGRCWSMDPQQIAHAPREMWWNPLADATTLENAGRLAGHFVAASVDASNAGDFWSKAAQNVLAQLFLAAALDKRPITDVMQWLAFPTDRTPLDLLRDHHFDAVAAQLKGTVEGPPETRDGIYETARQYAACLLSADITAWITPQNDAREFRPAEFVQTRDNLYLLSKDGGGGASALIAACADSVMRTATVHAERSGGRLDPPMFVILDEVANVCKISDLPELYSHLGSRGIIPFTILQSYRQGQKVWGEAGMDALWSAATIKLIGPGIDDADFADKLSRQVGDHDVETVSTSLSDSGTSKSISMRQERILPPDKIRALPKGNAILLATGMRVAMLTLRPWYKEPGAAGIAAASQRSSRAITTHAIAKTGPHQGNFGQAA
ncbi:type IV secretory system conjugative DNA transfer family protein [Streptomyces klenkii]